MSRITTPEEADKYLELFRTHENKYLIGLYQPGITIYKQQIRALNIFYCLHLTGRIKKDSIVAVIGGGISGLTFAAAASKSKIETHIFEKYDQYLPIQARCRGRELHPHIYDWPLGGSSVEDAELPILNWKRGTVERFCQVVLKELGEIKNSFQESGSSQIKYLNEYFNCRSIDTITYSTAKKKYSITAKVPRSNAGSTASKAVRISPDIIIYAIGYGLEKSSFGEKTPGYWRDIDTHQVNLTQKKYLISGTGDGALMDLFVILIKDFSYTVLLKCFNESEEGNALLPALQKLKREFFDKPRGANYIHKQLEALYSSCRGLINKLDLTITRVVLNGLDDFEDCLNLDKVSMLNAFFAYLLYKKRKFTFIKGELTYDPKTGESSIKGKSEKYDDYVHFFRHGTDRDDFLKDIPSLHEEVKANMLETRQKTSLPNGMIEKKWVNDDLLQIFRRAHYDEIGRVSANALPILECYTNILSNALSEMKKQEGNFRIALHKVEIKADGVYFVQVTPYVGTQNYTFKGGYSRLFRAVGNVGYSIFTGKPSLITMKDTEKQQDFEQFLTHLGLAHAGRKLTKRKAFFTMPILAPAKGPVLSAGEPLFSNLILYIDADHHSFFSHAQVFESILSISCGFVKAFESADEKQQFKMDAVDYTFDFEIDDGFSNASKSPFFRKDANFKKFLSDWELLVARKVITFKKFHSFTLAEHNQ